VYTPRPPILRSCCEPRNVKSPSQRNGMGISVHRPRGMRSPWTTPHFKKPRLSSQLGDMLTYGNGPEMEDWDWLVATSMAGSTVWRIYWVVERVSGYGVVGYRIFGNEVHPPYSIVTSPIRVRCLFRGRVTHRNVYDSSQYMYEHSTRMFVFCLSRVHGTHSKS